MSRIAELERQLVEYRTKHEVACSTLDIVKEQRTAAQNALSEQCKETKRLERQNEVLREALQEVSGKTLEQAVRACEKIAAARFAEHGIKEWDTGATYYSGRAAEQYESQDEENADCVAAIHALKADTTANAVGLSPIVEYVPGHWFEARTLDEMQAFYLSRLPAIREAAKEHGYAIGLHGSTRRDFDLMAMQWRAAASDKDALAHAIAVAACGITREGVYQWEQKPSGRFAASIPICWTDHANPDFKNKPSVGHIDLSVIDHGPPTVDAGGQHSSSCNCGADEEGVLKEIPLNVIRYWPEGMPARLEHVWKDLISFIPNYKLYDLQRVLAEYGFTMKIYEGVAQDSPTTNSAAHQEGGAA